MLEAALAAGIAAAGGDALLGGVLPTPAAAILVRRYGFDLAAVVSASHNPYRDNGIKFFGARRAASSPTRPRPRIEALRRSEAAAPSAAGRRAACASCSGGARGLPARAASRASRSTSRGRRVAARLRQRRHLPGRAGDLRAARRRGRARSRPSPTAATSTTGCGSTHLEAARRARRAARAPTIGFAFDGDGDRVLAVDARRRAIATATR